MNQCITLGFINSLNVVELMALGEQRRESKFSLFVKHAFKYYAVGGIGVLVNLGILYALKEYFGLWYLVSSAVAIYVSMTTNFLLNKSWTFRNTMIKQSNFFMYIKFMAISLVGMLIQLGFNYLFVNNMHMYYILAAFISIVIASGANFLLNRKITFGIRL